MRASIVAAAFCVVAAPTAASKPGSSPANQQVAYRQASNSSVSLVFANEDGSATSTIYSARTPFRFDLGPKGAGGNKVAIVQQPSSGRVGTVYIVQTSVNTSGLLVGGLPQDVGQARSGSNISFSPDGTKVAFACCSDGQQESLVVRDLVSGELTTWARGKYFWDMQWFRGGNSLAFATHYPSEVYEVASPSATPTLLVRPKSDGGGEVALDAVNGEPDKLLIGYNDEAGWARVGIWNAATGVFDNSDLAGTNISFNGNLNCTNAKLAYLGTSSSSGTQVWYIRDLTTGLNSRFRRDSNILLQFWPTC
jgi:hypothetical protein